MIINHIERVTRVIMYQYNIFNFVRFIAAGISPSV